MTISLADLAAEFPREAISWRAQSVTKDGNKAMALAYIDARDVMRRLDAVCGPENWKDSYVETPKGRVIATIEIWLGERWVSKSDGAGDTDVEGEKGGISDAFKRAAVKWGIGRYLYDLDAPWVPCDSYESEYQGKKKWVWKSWKQSPWNFIRGAANSNAPAPSEAPDHVKIINAAKTPDEAKDAFGAAWTSTADPEQRARYKQAYEAKKTDLATPLNFDELPPATQQAVKVARV
jgi:hypothetical protein